MAAKFESTCPVPPDRSEDSGLARSGSLRDGTSDSKTRFVRCSTGSGLGTGAVEVRKIVVDGTNTPISPHKTFRFNGPHGPFSINPSSDPGPEIIAYPPATTGFSITETVPTGYRLDDVTCKRNDTGDTVGSEIADGISLVPIAGVRIRCTFRNRLRTGKVEVSKRVIDGQDEPITPDQTFRFNGPNGAFSINPASDPDPEVIANLSVASEISITEVVPAGYDLDDVRCRRSDTNDTVGTDIAAGVSLTPIDGVLIRCQFTNRRATGTVRVSKRVIDDQDAPIAPDQTFTFSGPNGEFSINPARDPSVEVIANLSVTSEISITESVPAGYHLDDVRCRRSDTNETVGTNISDGVSLTPIDGVLIRCQFTNKRATGTVKVSKRVIDGQDGPITPDQTFTFNGPNGPFSINPASDPSPEVIANLSVTSEISITEVVPTGYDLDDVTCRRSDTNESVGTDIADGVSLTPIDGVLIRCTFTDRLRTGSIDVHKESIGGDDAFDFTVTGQSNFELRHGGHRTFENLAPGVYLIEEVDLPEGWRLKQVSCSDGGTRTDN
ncbi:MAG: prealbumin-like fold domain-containing protein, partial [Hyphomicrobiaceae bacterium]